MKGLAKRPVFLSSCDSIFDLFFLNRAMEIRSWIKRVGVLGLLFFLVKGLLWLLVPVLIAFLANS